MLGGGWGVRRFSERERWFGGKCTSVRVRERERMRSRWSGVKLGSWMGDRRWGTHERHDVTLKDEA